MCVARSEDALRKPAAAAFRPYQRIQPYFQAGKQRHAQQHTMMQIQCSNRTLQKLLRAAHPSRHALSSKLTTDVIISDPVTRGHHRGSLPMSHWALTATVRKDVWQYSLVS